MSNAVLSCAMLRYAMLLCYAMLWASATCQGFVDRPALLDRFAYLACMHRLHLSALKPL